MFTALTDHLSRYSLEDIPVAAHPSPLPARKFGSPEEISPNVFKSVESKQEQVCWLSKCTVQCTNRDEYMYVTMDEKTQPFCTGN